MKMVFISFEPLGDVTPSVLILGTIAAVVWYTFAPKNNIYDAFPRIFDNRVRALIWPSHVQDLVWEGYQKITKPTGKPFTVRWWAKDFLILPPKYLSSLRDAEWGHLSFFRTISDVVTKGLNPRMPQLTPIVEEEIEYALNAELNGKPGDTLVSHNAQQFFTAIVHRSASRIMIGEELCRNETFIKTSTEFVMSIFFTGLIIVKLPLGPLRDWLAYPLAAWHRRKLRQCTRMLRPVLQRRIEERQKSGGSQNRLDAIEWSLMLVPSGGEIDVPRLLDELMHNLWAGTSAPGGLVTDIIFQLLLEPKYKEMLVQEASKALGETGHWTEKALGRLPLLDSFIREINRLYPTGSSKKLSYSDIEIA
ncbi:hypothetical protein TruAng_008433 [Truncatella angustata]|nr:hypothetical protein TruAng_008433 [Truncatella angustata]